MCFGILDSRRQSPNFVTLLVKQVRDESTARAQATAPVPLLPSRETLWITYGADAPSSRRAIVTPPLPRSTRAPPALGSPTTRVLAWRRPVRGGDRE